MGDLLQRSLCTAFSSCTSSISSTPSFPLGASPTPTSPWKLPGELNSKRSDSFQAWYLIWLLSTCNPPPLPLFNDPHLACNARVPRHRLSCHAYAWQEFQGEVADERSGSVLEDLGLAMYIGGGVGAMVFLCCVSVMICHILITFKLCCFKNANNDRCISRFDLSPLMKPAD